MKVLITGVTGFIGTGIVNYLQSAPDILLYGHSRDESAARLKFANQSIKIEPALTTKIIDDLGIDCIIHLAGIAHDLTNQFKQEDYFNVNLEGTKNVFGEYVKSNATKFIFLSSIKACVDEYPHLVDEGVVPSPASDYGKSKLLAEQFISQVKLPAGKNAYVFRPTMIHGRGNKGNLNSLYRYVKSGLPYFFGAYSNKRSFLSAENLNFITLEFLKGNFPSGIYHLADDEPLSTNELVTIISSSLDRKPIIWRIPIRLVNTLSKIGTWAGLPIERMKRKLTESLIVSNDKLKLTLQKPLPVDSRTGVLNTLRSFNE